MLTRINIVSVLMTLHFFAISFGSLTPVNARFYGLLSFLLMVVLNAGSIFRQKTHHPVILGLQILGMLISCGIILSTHRPYVWLMWYVPLLYLFFDIICPMDEATSQIYLVWTAFVFSLCYVAGYHSSHVWWFLQTLSTQGSRVVGLLTGTQVVLGATGSGFWIFVSCLLCLFFASGLYAWKQPSQRAGFAIATGYLVIGYFAYTAYGQYLFQNLYRTLASTFGSTEL